MDLPEIKEEPIDVPDPFNEDSKQHHTLDPIPVFIKCENPEENDMEMENEDYNSSPQNFNELFPIIQISELDADVNTSVSHVHENLKKLGYKNPFVYTKLMKKQNKAKKSIWSCVICSVRKSDKDQLIEHYNMHKETEKLMMSPQTTNTAKWQCMTCSEVQSSKDDLLKHYETHKIETDVKKGVEIQGNYFMCLVCSAEFTSATMYDNHIDLNHGESGSICKTCKKPFKNLYSLCVHNFKKHSSGKTYKCTCCDFEHEDPKNLRTHLKDEHEKYSCEVCNKSFTTLSWYEEHKHFHEGQKLKCEICSKAFPYARNLVAHKKKNHPDTFADLSVSYSCTFCSIKFPNMKSLASHIRSHNGPSSLLCDLCGKSLSCYDHLKKHLRIHRGEKPFKCDVCGKGFSDKCNLKLHERVHSGEKPYICNVCNKGFSQRSSLVIHGRLHSGERPYKCELCDKGFVAKGLLGVHKKSCPGFLGK